MSVRGAVAALRAGGLVVVVDDADRENEADLVCSAALITPDRMAFMVRHTTGIVCVPMPAARCAELDLPDMVADNRDPHATAFTVGVDHHDAGTGVSATDRTTTVRALADPATRPGDLRRPGHLFGLRARPGGVLERAGHTEATVDLLDAAGLPPIGVISELVDDDGGMLRGTAITRFAAEHDLPVVTVAELVDHRRRTLPPVEPVSTASLPTRHGTFRAHAFRDRHSGTEHLALVRGDLGETVPGGILTRVHSECLTGDILGSARCDCGDQLDHAARMIAAEGRGVLVYLRGHEGRGIGLADKIHAYALQEEGLDTVEANTAQGLPADARTYDAAAHILTALGVRQVRLVTNNPSKAEALRGLGIDVTASVGVPATGRQENVRYLMTKRDRMGHDLHIRMG
ncbi:bifunctional 3,4-dihydroxy-2-butanone-4-phosphate synthase/GTP cyclohydrolase II [Pseudonocardia kongjuensis]|uniref:Multifunctional fusion protein n=1 Tax=Pseudonocardia kongjuensis TaxID=102227 RepID=A0ABP4I8P6_9PSEU